MYFLKTAPGSIAKDANVGARVSHGDLSDAALQQLSLLATEVFIPLLCNPANQAGWPEVVSREVVDTIYRFSSAAAVTVGLTKGQTLLPVPPVSEASAEEEDGLPRFDPNSPRTSVVINAATERTQRDLELIHVVEAAVVTWTKQIKNVLRTSPDDALKGGAHQGPLGEVEFWATKAASLNAVQEQLASKRIQRVCEVLLQTKSTFYPAFERLVAEAALAAAEANDNVKFLAPLAKLFDRLNLADDFGALPDLFPQIFHVLLLVWRHSGHYNTPARLAVMVRCVCNDVIAQCAKACEAATLFEQPPTEAVDKLRLAVKVCTSLRASYDAAASKSEVECQANPWRVPVGAMFARLDAFVERLTDLGDLFSTAAAFAKLERVEVGGTKGRTITASVRSVHADFSTAVARFHLVSYDVLDTETGVFDADYGAFRSSVRELERRLAALIGTALDDSPTVGRTFKLLDSFEGVLERDLIAADLEKKQLALLAAFAADLKEVSDVYAAAKAAPVLSKNAAPHSGAVAWVRALVQRVAEPMERLRGLGRLVADTPEGRDLEVQYKTLTSQLAEYEAAAIADWSSQAEALGDARLKQSLLLRDATTGTVAVNFDPALTKLLREVRYFLLQGVEVPPGAAQVYKRGEVLRQQTGNLELLAGLYNHAQKALLPVERPLVEKKLGNVDAALDRGLSELNWNSPNVDAYIQELTAQVKELDAIVAQLKGSVDSAEKVLAGWAKRPMFERREGRTYTLDEFREAHKAHLAARHAEVADGSAEISRLLAATAKTLLVPKGGTPSWTQYVENFSSLIVQGLVAAVLSSVKAVAASVDPEQLAKHETPPLLEVALELVAPDIVWQPEIGTTNTGESGEGGPHNHAGVRDAFDSWIAGFMAVGKLVARVDGSGRTYEHDLAGDVSVAAAVAALRATVLANEAACASFREGYAGLEYLWRRDLNETLHAFLTTNSTPNSEPPLDKFDAEIARYKAAQNEVAALPTGQVIGWLRVDAKPMKQALSTWVTKWVFLYTHYLFDKVVSGMAELYDFVGRANKTLEKDPASEGEDGAKQASLYEVMGTMRDIRKRAERTEAAFEPLRATVALLKGYGIVLEEATLSQLEEGPILWGAVRKRMLNVREKLTDLQQEEARVIRERSDAFAAKVDAFRAAFVRLAPFAAPGKSIRLEDVGPAYEALDAFRHGSTAARYACGSVGAAAAEGRALNEAQELFEIYISDYAPLRRCDEELNSLKALWDCVGVIMYTLGEWNKTAWDKIDVDYLVEEAKKVAREIKLLPKAARAFDAYRQLEEQVKALLTSLPLVSDLHHPSMRDRHWRQLCKATGKQFTVDESFTLGHMLALELNECVDIVSETVERAQKELVIEKALAKIEDTWTANAISFAPFSAASTVLNLVVDDAINEGLENDNMALQNMSASKYVKGNSKFQDQVTLWQRKLGTVDSVLTLWRDVCRCARIYFIFLFFPNLN